MANEPRRLLVRGFPHWLRSSEKESLLQHFGATEVHTMPTRGRMRNCVFATFATHEDAKRALGRLHQLCILESRLVVEYVQDKHGPLIQDTLIQDKLQDTSDDESPADEMSTNPVARSVTSHTEGSSLCSKSPPSPPPPPRLSYNYPPPSPTILTNITHTLASIPKFYVQVLHLMNLMDLPPPFGPLTSAPPLLLGQGEGSEEESEVGSDGESQATERPGRRPREVKRRAAHLSASRGLSPPAKRRLAASQPHFELISPLQAATKKIALCVPTKIEPYPPDNTTVVSIATIRESPKTALPHVTADSVPSSTPGEEEEEGREFISSEELAQNRLTEEEMQETSVFRGYTPGEPSLRLYIKNLAKHTSEQNLKYVYGRYIDWTDERESAAFDVRLMQVGRMKGQAFVGLPSEEKAAVALRETNGYQLAGKPMVVHYARTAKGTVDPSSTASHHHIQ